MSFIVAIDGPAGTGKGTITKLISKEMGLVNIDTGATYRCVALYCIENNINVADTEKIIDNLPNINIDMKNENGEQTVYLNGEDVTSKIRTPEVTKIVSEVSSIKEVRFAMVDVQRNLALGKDVIMEGRDITTYVFPNADVKIYMDADEVERANRRYKEMQEKGMEITFEEVLENIQKRDKNDKEKEIGALKIAEDAIYVDTTKLTIEEVKEKIKGIIEEKRGK
ncbi:MAG: (d)CMP kinase [Clostridia bacterium]|nr:(d)CMP kinase [Clostridia bacterium]